LLRRFFFTSLHFTSLHFTSLHFTSLHFISLHFTSLHFTSLHFTSLHFLKDDDERINPNGGAIALGHPLGMSGARILGSAALELHEKNKRYALVTMCIGVGQGYAVIIEKA